ncbi:[FeFe] hydrogenase H-cluster radical SAM maturase HydE (plasmid) [Entomospira entomophila]|uniref:[FeFe] hydrogenase H-cluster radical SAM maturase HydE n=1 Tax=Entomospira entomophila TaxID=2719988 RepID=A0A968KS59_9SPIO|nr:[FeFe] hydrogenase H-cluster radical SAM maturase HydE [Entomospira entomophilus]NIZ41473.1 [FeFe] hydrogenase H-cluster radical SAM maturase HydE [Entomospira entomophilus]WDI36307.1 [FeFe] hydrogenase H-cluster radical SAM maturase HydE [Entomospira entomophilus]
MIFDRFYEPVNEVTADQVWNLVLRIYAGEKLSYQEFLYLVSHFPQRLLAPTQRLAVVRRQSIYGKELFIRGLIEISNICAQDCYYCGIRASNNDVSRYAYQYGQLRQTIQRAYDKGYRTIVMQSGESNYFKDSELTHFIRTVTKTWPDLVITLSLGQKSREVYQAYFDAGARRFLLRHESADPTHYAQLHPPKQTLNSRLNCLKQLKEIGFQTGAGFMVGSPFQTSASLAHDLSFIQTFQPEMVGIGPYLNHPQTPFADQPNGDLEHVLTCYALARLIVPEALLPSTTATSSLDPQSGRLRALQSGCNVIMVNLSPPDQREQYSLYANKSYKGDESDEYLALIAKDVEKAGMVLTMHQGNHKSHVAPNPPSEPTDASTTLAKLSQS